MSEGDVFLKASVLSHTPQTDLSDQDFTSLGLISQGKVELTLPTFTK